MLLDFFIKIWEGQKYCVCRTVIAEAATLSKKRILIVAIIRSYKDKKTKEEIYVVACIE